MPADQIHKLKACPFCGNKNVIESGFFATENDTSKVECLKCNAKVYGDTLLEARRNWNRRADITERTRQHATNSDYTTALALINDIQHCEQNVLLIEHRNRAAALLSRLHFPKAENDA